MNAKVESLGRVVGRNVRRLRADRELSLDDVAATARQLGFSWSGSRVSAIQRGERDPKLSTVLALARVLECEISELLQTDAERVDLGEVTVATADLAGLFGPVPSLEPSDPMTPDEWAAFSGWASADQMATALRVPADTLYAMSLRSGLTERRTARALDLDENVLNAVTYTLLGTGRTFSEIRDHLAEVQHRSPGDVTAELRAQLAEHIADWPDSRRNPTPRRAGVRG